MALMVYQGHTHKLTNSELNFVGTEKLVDGAATLAAERRRPGNETLAAHVPCLTCFLDPASLQSVIVRLKHSSNPPRS